MLSRWKDRPLMGALVFFAVVLTAANLILLLQRPPTTWREPVEVEAASQHLARLAARTAVVAPNSDATVQLIYAPGDPCGAPFGLVILGQFTHDNRAAGPESQLWFRLQPWSALPRNPAGEALKTVMMVRSETGTDWAGADEAGHLRVVVVEDTALEEGPQPTLRLNNLPGDRGWKAASIVAPELFRVMASGRCNLLESELQFLRWLARSLRSRVCDDLDTPGSRCYDTAITLYRDRPVTQYRMDLRVLGDSTELLALSLEVERNRSGKPTRLGYRVLEGSTLQKSANLFFVRPQVAGALLNPQEPGFHGLRYDPGEAGAPRELPEGIVELQALWRDLPDLGIPSVEEPSDG